MSPNLTFEAPPSFPPRLTVAKRKEATELRKTMKPLMEKRRRARINDSLNLLKSLILPLTGRDKCRYSKLEKADILEMTVRFLSDIPPANTKNSADSYREGYKACLQRVSAQLPKTNLDPDACQRVTDFVHKSVSALHPELRELPRPELQVLPSDASKAPEPEVQLQIQQGEPAVPQRSSSSSAHGAPRAAQLCVETLVDPCSC